MDKKWVGYGDLRAGDPTQPKNKRIYIYIYKDQTWDGSKLGWIQPKQWIYRNWVKELYLSQKKAHDHCNIECIKYK